MAVKFEREKIYLAALLHDIGKFYQRASGNENDEDSNLRLQSKNIKTHICPTNSYNNHSHKHVLWTNEFFESNQDIFKEVKEKGNAIFNVNIWNAEQPKGDNLANLACNHHKPHTKLQKIIQTADFWSAGIDRYNKSEEDKEFKHHGFKFNDFRSVPLFTVFNQLRINGEINVKPDKVYVPQELKIEQESIFPNSLKQEQIHSYKESYANMWDGFAEAFKKLPQDSFTGFEESLMALLKKYTWAIPSNTMDMANVSLFDHLKTTASIADSLYQASMDDEFKNAFNYNTERLSIDEGSYPVMLLGVDISGIQSFIYDIASSKAAKSLKGRSFYLQLLTEALQMKFKNHPDIKALAANVLYAAGGKFYMILPNIPKVKDAIHEIRAETEAQLWKEHKGKLSVNFAHSGFAFHSKKVNDSWHSWVTIEDKKDEECQMKDLWKAVADKLTSQKQQKFRSLIIDNYEEFFDESHPALKASAESQYCHVTGEDFALGEKVEYLSKDLPVKEIVKSQSKLGEALKDADYLLSLKNGLADNTYLQDKTQTPIEILGAGFYLFDDLELVKTDADFRKITSADVATVSSINSLTTLTELKGKGVTYDYMFYGGNKQALKNNDAKHKENKTFEELIKTETGKDSLLGVLRMDIDNLGKLFIEGFDAQQMSFSAFATLSFQLELFFSGYLNVLREEERFKDWVNILYSGGDDLFVVGRWDKALQFAEQVKKQFKKYTGRKDIGISGGLAFVHGKFPIAKAAQMAGEAEARSKAIEGKDAFTFFGTTVKWEHEFDTVKELKEKLVNYIDEYGLTHAILHQLIRYKTIKDQHLYTGKTRDYSFLWHTAYYLKRYSEKFKPTEKKQRSDVYSFILDLQEKLFTSGQDNYRYYDLAGLASRWAEKELKYIKNT